MPLEQITRAEFDKRLDAANARRAQEVQEMEAQQEETERLLALYDTTLNEMKAELNRLDEANNTEENRHSVAHLRERLIQLAEQTASAAASL